MAQIREVIELLTRVLRSNGTSKVRAETFRLAKFDNDEAVGPLWRLLFELIYFCKYGYIDEVSVKAFAELSTGELIVFVKREMQRRGFYSRDFASLPNDMSEGARELLLALGWLMCKENIVDKFMENCSSPLNDDSSGLYGAGDGDKPSNTMVTPRSPRVPDDPDGRIKYLLWLNGKLRMSLRNLYALQREKNVLSHKLREATQGVSLSPDKNHLSVLEIMMLRHPELLKKNLTLLEKDNERLQDLLKWRHQEDIFWKWMESVLDVKLKEADARKEHQNAVETQNLPMNIPAEAVSEMKKSRSKIRESITKYEAILEHLERLWIAKSSNVTKEEIDSILASIDEEIQQQGEYIALNSPTRKTSQRQFVFSPETSTKKTLKVPSLESDPEVEDIKQSIGMLEETLQTVEEEIDRKYSMFRQGMEMIAGRLGDDVVCIPPAISK